jgi:RNA polymerase sigma-70 factor, ECF subfamily
VTDTPDLPDHADAWVAERPRLVGLAYRILGTVGDADDVVQDAGLTWLTVDHASIANPAAFLTTLVSRRAIDRLRSAAVARTTYVGPWLPEPLLTSDDDPFTTVALAESVTFGFLTLLERLEPIERAVFVLHEVFDEAFDDIARIVDRSPTACRQIAHRARERVRSEHRRSRPLDPERRDSLLLAFLGAAANGDLTALQSMLRDDAVLVSDGGADRHAARRPVVGPDRIARFVANVVRRRPSQAVYRPVLVNGTRGVLSIWGGSPQLLLFGESDGERFHSLWSVRSAEKLRQFELLETELPDLIM